MLKKRLLQFVPVLLACVIVAGLASPTHAQKRFLERLRRVYELQKEIGNCQVCHEKKPNEEESRKNLNVFGKSIQGHADMKPLLGKDDNFAFSEKDLALFISIVNKLDNEDSDKDGATNKEEMDLRTFPGDPKSVPDKVRLEKYRKEKGTKAPAPPATPKGPAPATPKK